LIQATSDQNALDDVASNIRKAFAVAKPYEERLGRVRVGGQPVGVRAQAGGVRVGHAVVADGERVELHTLQLRLDSLPIKPSTSTIAV